MKTRNLTILLTDIKGFTDKTAHQSRTQMMEMLKKHEEIVLPVIEEYKGKLVKTIGDAFLVTFLSPTDAVLCGVAIQDRLREYNREHPREGRIDVRIAINAGEVSMTEDDIYGDAVNITSRLESIAEAGEVFFTESVYLSMNKREVPSSEVGYRTFKGIPEQIKVYKVLRETPVGEGGFQAGDNADQNDGDFDSEAAPGPGPQDIRMKPGSPRAGFFRRLTALLLDVFILFVIYCVLFGSPCQRRLQVDYDWTDDGSIRIGDMKLEPAKTLSISVKQKDVADIARMITKKVGVNIIVAPEVTGIVDLELQDTPWQDALLDALKTHGFTAGWTNDSTIMIGSPETVADLKPLLPEERGALPAEQEESPGEPDTWQKPVTIELEQVDLRRGLKSITRGAGINIVIADEVQGTTSILFHNTPLREVFETTVRANGFDFMWTDEKTVLVAPPEIIEEKKKKLAKEEFKHELKQVIKRKVKSHVKNGLKRKQDSSVRRARKRWRWFIILIWALYGALFVTFKGATPGKLLLKIRVVRFPDESAVTFWQAFARCALMYLSLAALLLGFFWALWERDKRTWHDLIANTVVIEEDAIRTAGRHDHF